jgi:hypothetical protein
MECAHQSYLLAPGLEHLELAEQRTTGRVGYVWGRGVPCGPVEDGVEIFVLSQGTVLSYRVAVLRGTPLRHVKRALVTEHLS